LGPTKVLTRTGICTQREHHNNKKGNTRTKNLGTHVTISARIMNTKKVLAALMFTLLCVHGLPVDNTETGGEVEHASDTETLAQGDGVSEKKLDNDPNDQQPAAGDEVNLNNDEKAVDEDDADATNDAKEAVDSGTQTGNVDQNDGSSQAGQANPNRRKTTPPSTTCDMKVCEDRTPCSDEGSKKCSCEATYGYTYSCVCKTGYGGHCCQYKDPCTTCPYGGPANIKEDERECKTCAGHDDDCQFGRYWRRTGTALFIEEHNLRCQMSDYECNP